MKTTENTYFEEKKKKGRKAFHLFIASSEIHFLVWNFLCFISSEGDFLSSCQQYVETFKHKCKMP